MDKLLDMPYAEDELHDVIIAVHDGNDINNPHKQTYGLYSKVIDLIRGGVDEIFIISMFSKYNVLRHLAYYHNMEMDVINYTHSCVDVIKRYTINDTMILFIRDTRCVPRSSVLIADLDTPIIELDYMGHDPYYQPRVIERPLLSDSIRFAPRLNDNNIRFTPNISNMGTLLNPTIQRGILI